MKDDPTKRPPLPCARCRKTVALGRGEGYLVDIRAVADPTPPIFTGDDLSQDASREISRLLMKIRGMSNAQLAVQVYRRKLLCLCTRCYANWIEDPVGRERTMVEEAGPTLLMMTTDKDVAATGRVAEEANGEVAGGEGGEERGADGGTPE